MTKPSQQRPEATTLAVPIVAVLDPRTQGEVVQALRDFARRCATEGRRPSAGFGAVLATLSQPLATTGRDQVRQGATGLADHGDRPHRAARDPLDLLDKRDVAAVLGCSVRTVERVIERGELTAVHGPAGGIRIRRSDFERYVRSLTPTRGSTHAADDS